MTQPEKREQQAEQQIVRADPRLRRRVVWCTLALATLALVGVAGLHYYVQSIVERAGGDLGQALPQVRRLGIACAWVTGLGIVAVGLWFGWLGWKTYRWDQYPPPGWKVIRDTPLRTGPAARRIGRLALAVAATCAVAGAAVGWLLHRLVASQLR